jgi:predicted dehydrogenase
VKRPTSRREFFERSALAGVGFWIGTSALPARSQSANDKLNIGVIGAGGKGASDTDACSGENIVALCDVDEHNAAETYKKYPKATKYHDFRKMLEKEKLDAVVVSTPDHMHAPASIMAMRMGKHVYTQKPLTHDVWEARRMREVAKEEKVATQMGNQGTSNSGLREACEVVQAGGIGPVSEVHVWTNRPIWPQGIGRPSEAKPVPSHVKWDLWLGVAPERPYHDAYCPFKWRGWWDFGTGALGDMACHTANMPFMALKLEYPTAIEAESSEVNAETYPSWSKIRFDFPARGDMPPVKFWWYDGGKTPSRDLVGGRELSDSGCLLFGGKGVLFSPNDYGARFDLLPADKFEGYQKPPKTIPRSPGHYEEWIRAAKGGEPAMSSFDYAALLTETILLGNIALRVGKKVEWDGPKMRSTNCPEANNYVRREYRKGWDNLIA